MYKCNLRHIHDPVLLSLKVEFSLSVSPFFRKIVLCTACKSQSYFVMLSPRLSLTDIICLHFHFSVSRPGMEGIQSPTISFCLFVYMLSLQVFIARAMCGIECKSRRLVHQLQSAEVSRTLTSSFV